METVLEIRCHFFEKIICIHLAEDNTLKKTVLAAIAAGTNLAGASLGRINLYGANMQGVKLPESYLACAILKFANLSYANLAGADLGLARLQYADLRGANLRGANLEGANLSGADLRGADFTDARLRGAVLTGTMLTTTNLVLPDPVPDLDARLLDLLDDKGNRLDMDNWHTCRSTHCRAGWAITLAGAAGQALELLHGSGVAGSLIYAAAYPQLPVPDFYAEADAAYDDISNRAGMANA